MTWPRPRVRKLTSGATAPRVWPADVRGRLATQVPYVEWRGAYATKRQRPTGCSPCAHPPNLKPEKSLAPPGSLSENCLGVAAMVLIQWRERPMRTGPGSSASPNRPTGSRNVPRRRFSSASAESTALRPSRCDAVRMLSAESPAARGDRIATLGSWAPMLPIHTPGRAIIVASCSAAS